jgi:molybdate transport system substrate-binding protein
MPKVFLLLLSIICAAILSTPRAAVTAEIKVFCDGPLEPAMMRMAETFRRDSGHTVNFVFGLSPAIHKRVTDGEPADLIVIQPNFIGEMVNVGKVAAGDHPVVARVGIGFMVRADANAPDVSTPEAVKQALLKVDTLVFNNVASGNAFAKTLERLGIADTIKDKIVRASPAEVTTRIVQGTGNDIGVGTTTLILADNRLKLAGALPTELQSYLLYAAALMTQAQAPEVAKEFIRFLASPQAKAQFAAAGVN